jgi:hypothetical protein
VRTPKHRVLITGVTALAGAVLVPMTSADAAPAVPPTTHCAVGFPLLAISQFDPIYQDWLHNVVDANGNGYVCARQQPDAVATAMGGKLGLPPGYPVYLATDDSIVP